MKKLLIYNFLVQVIFFVASLASIRIFDTEHKSWEMFSYIFYFNIAFCFFYFILNFLFLQFLEISNNFLSKNLLISEIVFTVLVLNIIIFILDSEYNLQKLISNPYYSIGTLILIFSNIIPFTIIKPNQRKTL